MEMQGAYIKRWMKNIFLQMKSLGDACSEDYSSSETVGKHSVGGPRHAGDKFLCLVQQCSEPAQHLMLQLECHTVPLYELKRERDREMYWCVLENVSLLHDLDRQGVQGQLQNGNPDAGKDLMICLIYTFLALLLLIIRLLQ